jgi:hypothetical protein
MISGIRPGVSYVDILLNFSGLGENAGALGPCPLKTMSMREHLGQTGVGGLGGAFENMASCTTSLAADGVDGDSATRRVLW